MLYFCTPADGFLRITGQINWPYCCSILIKMLNGLKNFLIRNYIPYQNAKIGKVHGNQPVALAYWLDKRRALKRFSTKDDILIASKRVLKTRGEDLPVRALKDMLSGVLLGDWALDKASIMVLWQRLQEERPRIIIESGSGTSTLIHARYFQLHQPDGRVISLEQDDQEKTRVEELLNKHGLSSFAHVLYAPLDQFDRYQVDADVLEKILGQDKADWLVIDGPSGKPGCRSAVMDAMLPYMTSKARWFTDDAFRDGELDFLQRWQQTDHIIVEGIIPVGKGLATGIIR